MAELQRDDGEHDGRESRADGSWPHSPQDVARLALIIRAVLVGVGVVWTSVVLLAGGFIPRHAWEQGRRALVWRPVGAKVKGVEAVTAVKTAAASRPEGPSGDEPVRPTAEARIRYEFTLDGRTYAGQYRRPKGRGGNEFERSLARPLAPGDSVTAWYDPADPSRHELDPCARPSGAAFSLVFIPFKAAGLWFLAMGLLSGRLRRKLTDIWTLNEEHERSGRRGRPPKPYLGLVWPFRALGAYVVLSFAGAFVLFNASMGMPWRPAWALAAGLAAGLPVLALAYGWIWHRIHKAKAARMEREGAGAAAPAVSLPAPLEFAGADGEAPPPVPSGWKTVALLAFFGLFWCSLTGMFLSFVVYSLVRHADAMVRYRPAPAVVVASRVETGTDSDGHATYRPAITYRYTVDGREFAAERITFDEVSTGNRRESPDWVAAHLPGTALTVYYDPARPSQAVLQREVSGSIWFLLLFLQPFILVGLGLIASVFGAIRSRRTRARFLAVRDEDVDRIPGWGAVVRHPDGPMEVRSGPPVWARPLAFAIGYGGVCFVSIYVLGFGGMVNARAGTPVAVALSSAALVGFAALWIAGRRLRAKVLRVDPLTRTVSCRHGKSEFEHPLEAVQGWIVRVVRDKDSSSDSGPSYSARLEMTLADSRETIHDFGYTDSEVRVAQRAAELLTRWTGKPVV